MANVATEQTNDVIELAPDYDFNVRIYSLISFEKASQYLIAVFPEKPTPKEEPKIDIPVQKRWYGDDSTGTRPSSITVDLYLNEVETGKSITLTAPNWNGTFTGLDDVERYSVKERDLPIEYSSLVTGDQKIGFTITNSLKTTDVTVSKIWSDGNNRDGKRPTSINVTLYENGSPTSKTATLSASNYWEYTFYNLPKYKNGRQVSYTIQETVPGGYTASYSGNGTKNVIITNTHEPEKTQVNVKKVWNDSYNGIENFDEIRKPITVTLWQGSNRAKDVNGNVVPQIVLNEVNDWSGTFTNLYKYENGREIAYSIEENRIPEGYTLAISGDKTNGFIITNTHGPHYEGYVEISGKAWVDGESGKGSQIDGEYKEGSTDKLLPGVKVTLKEANGNPIKSTYTDGNGRFTRTDYAITDANGNYTIRVNYDNSQNVYKLYEDANTVKTKLQTAYVEFEYDGMKYTTVRTATTEENTSKAKENETLRNTFDSTHSKVTAETEHPDRWTDKNITAVTKDIISFETYKDRTTKKSNEIIKYCNGNGTYKRTNWKNAWEDITTGNHTCESCARTGHSLKTFDVDVGIIQNVNLGLFEREQPDVAIFSDLTKVEVEMNNQKYTYLYGVRGSKLQAEGGLQTQFQNKDTYTYRRPVNPADIAYIQEPANSNKMSVKVTYEVKVANLSSTLVTTINKISNYFDSQYTLTNASGWTITTGDGFKKATTNGNLNITLNPGKESSTTLIYEVSMDAIRGLLNKDATLNNAVEIESYSTLYGEKTLYAEERTGGSRTNKPYAGYDYDSHPGNANIKLLDNGDGVKRLYSTDASGNIIPTDKVEDDTDIAPSFVLCKDDEPKILSGTVWEDANTKTDGQRVGNGKREDNENKVKNVKIEAYEIKSDGTIGNTPATLYQIKDNTVDKKQAVINTGDDGHYQFNGLVTGVEYLIRYTYGNDTREETKELENATTIVGNEVNARNYKSTIITDDDPKIKNILETQYAELSNADKMWPLTHKDRYSVAVDNMEDRLRIGVLTNSTYKQGENMTAYTKPFIIPLELTLGTKGNSDENGNVQDITGTKIEKELNKLDFGIIERPKEELIIQKTISYFKISLANGQVLTEGDPRDPNANINYAKAMGFKENKSVEEVIKAKALGRRLLVEIDSELTQGAQLEVTYAVKVINNSEIDYDYGELSDYTNGYIAKGDKASYYYYGERKLQEEMKSTLKFVDYLDNDLVYKEDTNTWKAQDTNTLEKLKTDGFIDAETVYPELKKGGYKILQTKEDAITIARGDSTEPLYMTTSKLLAVKDDNTFYNHAEIIEIDGKTGRTKTEGVENIPGNYNPSLGSNETDDDSVNITITPPTGITNYITTYIIAGLVGLIIIVIGIAFIKKKVLTK